jgi:drug/metabolite transporter (DMT)-like permease
MSFLLKTFRNPTLVLLGITAVWGSSFIVTKNIQTEVPTLLYILMRFALAALILMMIFPHTLRLSKKNIRNGLVLGLLQTSGLVFQGLGQLSTMASKSAFITSLNTPLTPILLFILFREKPPTRTLIGVFVSTLGLFLLTVPETNMNWNSGDLLTLVSAFIYAGVIIEVSRRSRNSEFRELATWQTIFSALLSFLLLMFVHSLVWFLDSMHIHVPQIIALQVSPIHITSPVLLEIVYMAIACTLITFLGQTWAMARMSATRAAIIFSTEPLFASFFAITVAGAAEWPGTRGALAAVFIFLGVMISEFTKQKNLSKASLESLKHTG